MKNLQPYTYTQIGVHMVMSIIHDQLTKIVKTIQYESNDSMLNPKMRKWKLPNYQTQNPIIPPAAPTLCMITSKTINQMIIHSNFVE
jgi:hypothetical protein